jgi:uncharacterized protein (TIRG00374 family)
MKAKKSFINCLKVLFTIFLLFLVFQSVDISKIGRNLKAFNLGSLILLLAVCWAGQLICSQRWRIIAASLQMKGSYFSFIQMYFVGMFFNVGLPTLVGGDVIKAYAISRKSGRPLQIGLASVLQDRAAGMISLIIYGSLAILIRPISWRGFPLWAAYVLSWIVITFSLWLITRGARVYDRFLVAPNPTSFQRALKTIAELHQALGVSRLSTGAALRIAVYSFMNSGLILWVFRQVTVAARHPVGFISFCTLYPLVTIATMLPITLSGLGVREWIYVDALSLVGIPRDLGLVISLATSTLLVVCNLAGIIFLPGLPREMRQRAQDFSEHASSEDT